MTAIVPIYSVFNCANLWTEMSTGPLEAAISAKGADDQGIANLLNDKSDTATAAGLVNHADVQGGDLTGVVDYGEVRAAMSPNDVSIWNGLVAASPVKIGSSNVQNFIESVFLLANFPNSLPALRAFYTQRGSRLEVAFGTGQSVTAQQVYTARTTSGAGSF